VAITPNIGPLREFGESNLHITWSENDMTGGDVAFQHRLIAVEFCIGSLVGYLQGKEIEMALEPQIMFESKA